jgi:hypothetical protein
MAKRPTVLSTANFINRAPGEGSLRGGRFLFA